MLIDRAAPECFSVGDRSVLVQGPRSILSLPGWLDGWIYQHCIHRLTWRPAIVPSGCMIFGSRGVPMIFTMHLQFLFLLWKISCKWGIDSGIRACYNLYISHGKVDFSGDQQDHASRCISTWPKSEICGVYMCQKATATCKPSHPLRTKWNPLKLPCPIRYVPTLV